MRVATIMPTLSLRIPGSTKARLHRTAKKMHRSQSSLMLEALESHLDKLQRTQTTSENQGKFTKVLAFKGAGIELTGGQTAQEIDEFVSELRTDE